MTRPPSVPDPLRPGRLLRLRGAADRLFTGLASGSVILIALALVVVLAPMLWRGATAVVFRGTVEFRLMQMQQFGRGRRADLAAELAQVAEARRPVYALLDRFSRGIATEDLEEEARRLYREFGKQLDRRDTPPDERTALRSLARRLRDGLAEAVETTDKAAAREALARVVQHASDPRLKGTVAEGFFAIARDYGHIVDTVDLSRRGEYAKALGEVRKTGDSEKTAAAEKILLARQAEQKRANDAAIDADRGYRAAMAPGLTILTKPRPRLGATRKPAYRHVPVADRALTRTARDCIEEALNAVKDAPNLYVENAARIAGMLKSIPAADAKAITDARERLVRGNILAGDDSAGWRLTPLLDGNTPPSDRLSNAQRNRLEWFNIELMNRLLYPGTLRLAFTRNHVPNKLTSPVKVWRDVYHYDNTGYLTGWTRYDADKITNFTPDGKVLPSLSLSAHHAGPSDGPYPRPAGRENVGASVFDLLDLARPAAIRPASNRGHACPRPLITQYGIHPTRHIIPNVVLQPSCGNVEMMVYCPLQLGCRLVFC